MSGPKAEGAPRIRASPEDFVVDELPLYPAEGEGGHTFVRIEKRGRNTEEVVRALARALGIKPADVGYAGRKDRNAITRQWISLPGVAPEALASIELPGVAILEAIPHPHKLRTGQLRGNRFEIWVRDVDDALAAEAEARIARMCAVGMPNRFGEQRFGHGGENVERGREILEGGKGRGDRRSQRFLLSALQSQVFNHVLAERATPLETVELGDVAQVVASGGLFVVEDLERENERAAAFEISATGPIFGTKMKSPSGAVAEREAAVMQAMGLPPMDALKPPRGIRLRGARRPLRVCLEDTSLERSGGDCLLRATLPAGSYITVLLEELFGEVRDSSR
jgi:tRNA pseudouridine13 synthase